MPSPSRTHPNDADKLDGPPPATSRIHVLVTPTEDTRALLSSLAALSVARDPRLTVTAVEPRSGLLGWTFDRRFRILEAAGEGELETPHRELITTLDLGPEDLVVFLRAGALPPRGWIASLILRTQETRARGIAALSWSPRPSGSAETELLGWEAEAHGAQLHHCHHSEDRAELETPLLAVARPDLVVPALAEFWAARCAPALNLGSPNDDEARLVVAKDLLVWHEDGIPPIVATLAAPEPEVHANAPSTIEEADALEARLAELIGTRQRPELHIRLAELAIARGDRSRAMLHARRCIESWPDHAAAQLIIARSLTGDDRLVAARRIIENLLSMGPLEPRDRASAFACLASIWLREGEPAQARPCLEVALTIDADHPVARYGMARLALAAGRFIEALEHLELCLTSAPLSPDMHYELGRARVLAGQLDGGMQALGFALQLKPDHRGAADLLERLSGH